jgi:hypothetical protein
MFRYYKVLNNDFWVNLIQVWNSLFHVLHKKKKSNDILILYYTELVGPSHYNLISYLINWSLLNHYAYKVINIKSI